MHNNDRPRRNGQSLIVLSPGQCPERTRKNRIFFRRRQAKHRFLLLSDVV
jgi:hypothetical protein